MRRTCQTTIEGLQWLIKKGVPVKANADWQENSAKPCDTGSEISDISTEFPQIDFSEVDPIYPTKTPAGFGNPYEFSRKGVVARGQRALRWLYNRPEKVIAVVSHSGFLRCAVCHTRFANADYRVFDFDGEQAEGEEIRLKEWTETEAPGGGMGRSEKGKAYIQDTDFPPEVEKVQAEMGEQTQREATKEVPEAR